MSVPELIANVLEALRVKFYAERIREFKRDERALTKAIAKWGYEAAQREWHFTPEEIFKDIMDLLIQMQTSGSDVKYLPLYLQSAIHRRFGQRAEDLQAAARKVAPRVAKLMAGVRTVEAVREPSATEVLATLYTDLKRVQKQRRAERKPVAKQETLL